MVLVFLPVVVWFIWTRRRRSVPLLAAIGMAVALSDAASGLILKNAFPRTRPNGTTHSFPSSHAANTFAAATVLMFEAPVAGIPALCIAALVSASRVLREKHWPSDVVVGALIGVLMGTLAVLALRVWIRRRDGAPALTSE